MASLREKTVSGFFWNLMEIGSSQIINFVGTLILSRYLLTPAEFGLVGYALIFTSLAQVFVDSGFSQALIRKQNCTDTDYSTVFYTNLTVGVALYLLLFLVAPTIASYYNEPTLTQIVRTISLMLPISAMSMIQRTILVKQLNFKKQALITFTATITGFSVAIVLGYQGYGAWSLVWKTVLVQAVVMLALWGFDRWRPLLVFSKQSFKELFGFGSKLLLIYTLAASFKSIYNHVIGKFYGKNELGLYSNADTMASVPSGMITTVINKVAYSALSGFQDDNAMLKERLRAIMRPVLLCSFTALLVLAVVGESVLLLLLTDKWAGIGFYFQVLCVSYMAVILHTENQIVMNIKGRSDYFLITEIIKYILFIPVLVVGLKFGIKALLYGFAIHSWVGFVLNAMFTKKLINYGIGQQLRDLAVPILYALVVAAVAAGIGYAMQGINLWLMLSAQLIGSFLFAVILARLFRVRAYREIMDLIIPFLKKKH